MEEGERALSKKKQVEPLPDEFASYGEAAEFWETHGTADYLDAFETVAVETNLKQREEEVEEQR